MNVTDPIADLLTRIRNAIRSGHAAVEIPASKLKIEVLKILRDQELIGNFKLFQEGERAARVTVLLKYDGDGQCAISSLKRVSRPGCRVYLKKEGISPVLNGLGISVISTSRGLMTGTRAIEEGLGGEILCDIY